MTATPNLFVVGSGKAGTTWMHRVLGQHPDVYAPSLKEPHWMGRDLGLAPLAGIHGEGTYLDLYRGGSQRRYRLDASPSSLLSPTAADRIRVLSSDAHILMILRDPIDTIPALHGQLALADMQAHRDLARAVDHSRARWGEPLTGLGLQVWTRYHDVVSYSGQVERYLDRFPAERLHILWFNDLRRDPSAFYRLLLKRLELPLVDVDLSPANVSPRVRSPRLSRVIARPPLETTLRKVLPPRVAQRVRRRLFHLNVRSGPREGMLPDTRAELAADLRPDVDTLGALLGRDLSSWCQAAAPSGSSPTAGALDT